MLAACGALPPLAPDQERRQATVDGVTVTLDSARAPQVNTTQHLRVTLTDRQGRPIDGADVFVDLEMDMLCLSGAAPSAEPMGSGQYEAITTYQMPGDWRVTVIARGPAGEYRAQFQIAVADPAPE